MVVNVWPGYVTVTAGDVLHRDGISCELYRLERPGSPVWEVFREDGGPFPIFTAQRGPGADLGDAPILEFTTAVVADLLAGAELTDAEGWYARNIAGALALAATSIEGWAGEEWAVVFETADRPRKWADPAGERFCFARLDCRTVDGDVTVRTGQNDVSFDLIFRREAEPLTAPDPRSDRRLRVELDYARGDVRRVAVAFDNTPGAVDKPGVLTEALLETTQGAVLFVAADAYNEHEWHLYEEEVVVIPDAAQVDQLSWVHDRQPWFDRLPPLL